MKRLTLLLIATSLLASCGAAPVAPSDGNSPLLLSTLTWQLAQKYGDSQKQITLTIEQQTLTHARATVRFGPAGTPSGLILARKSGGQWLIVFDGNGSVDCDALKSEEFPAEMLKGICD